MVLNYSLTVLHRISFSFCEFKIIKLMNNINKEMYKGKVKYRYRYVCKCVLPIQSLSSSFSVWASKNLIKK